MSYTTCCLGKGRAVKQEESACKIDFVASCLCSITKFRINQGTEESKARVNPGNNKKWI